MNVTIHIDKLVENITVSGSDDVKKIQECIGKSFIEVLNDIDSLGIKHSPPDYKKLLKKYIRVAKDHKPEITRDVIVIPNGTFTPEEIKLLKELE